jgi:hypothetical protein
LISTYISNGDISLRNETNGKLGKMELTWDLVAQTVFFAAMLSVLWGIGKITASLIIAGNHIKDQKNNDDYIKKLKEDLKPDLWTAEIEMLVGWLFLVPFNFPGVLNEQGSGIILLLTITLGGFILLILLIMRATQLFSFK